MKQSVKGLVAILYVGIGMALVLGIVVGWALTRSSTSSPVSSVLSENKATLVNMPPLDYKNLKDYFRSQIMLPKGYFVSSDDMLVSYASQGGMAPPRLILMKGYQVLGEENFYKAVTDNPSHACIAVWATMGFSTLEDWQSSITQFPNTLSDKQTIQVGKRTATMYTLKKEKGNIFVAFLPIGDEAKTSYYLTSCNDTNKQDFISVVKSLKFRPDVSYE